MMLLKGLTSDLLVFKMLSYLFDTIELVKKAEYNTKNWRNWKEITNQDKNITTQEFNKLTSENSDARLT